MRWQGRRESSNVEDRRGMPVRGAAIGGVGTLVIIVLGLIFGVNPMTLLNLANNVAQQAPARAPAGAGAQGEAPPETPRSRFIKVVMADTEDVWNDLFRRMGRNYREPTLVLYSGATPTEGCGYGQAAVGPFYCPGDEKVYLDLDFFDEMANRFGAAGDFAQAYVVAHEVGHHVQNLMGITGQIDRQRGRVSQTEYNELSVRLELQADFLAGVWAHHAQEMKDILEPGDIQEALKAANAIGDDTLQEQSQGYAVPDSFTHGTSEQRVRWFRLGFETGDLDKMDTFALSDREL